MRQKSHERSSSTCLHGAARRARARALPRGIVSRHLGHRGRAAQSGGSCALSARLGCCRGAARATADCACAGRAPHDCASTSPLGSRARARRSCCRHLSRPELHPRMHDALGGWRRRRTRSATRAGAVVLARARSERCTRGRCRKPCVELRGGTGRRRAGRSARDSTSTATERRGDRCGLRCSEHALRPFDVRFGAKQSLLPSLSGSWSKRLQSYSESAVRMTSLHFGTLLPMALDYTMHSRYCVSE